MDPVGFAMSDNSPFLVLNRACGDAIEWIREQFTIAGLQVVRTFDLQVARKTNMQCPFPNHDSDQCDCQMVVLLVYKPGYHPISIVAHGYDGQTWFSIVDSPQQRADPKIEAAIRHALVSRELPPINIQTASNVS